MEHLLKHVLTRMEREIKNILYIGLIMMSVYCSSSMAFDFDDLKDLADDVKKNIEKTGDALQKDIGDASKNKQESNKQESNKQESNIKKSESQSDIYNLYNLFHIYNPKDKNAPSVDGIKYNFTESSWSSLEGCSKNVRRNTNTRGQDFLFYFRLEEYQIATQYKDRTKNTNSNGIFNASIEVNKNPKSNIVTEKLYFQINPDNRNQLVWTIDWRFISNSNREVINFIISQDGVDKQMIKDGNRVATPDIDYKSTHIKRKSDYLMPYFSVLKGSDKVDQTSFFNYKCRSEEQKIAYTKKVNDKEIEKEKFAVSPAGVSKDLKLSYVTFMAIQDCRNNGIEYRPYVTDSVYEKARKVMKIVEKRAKKKASSINTDEIWNEAKKHYPKTSYSQNIEMGKMFGLKWSKDIDQLCNMAVASIMSEAPKVTPKKDF